MNVENIVRKKRKGVNPRFHFRAGFISGNHLLGAKEHKFQNEGRGNKVMLIQEEKERFEKGVKQNVPVLLCKSPERDTGKRDEFRCRKINFISRKLLAKEADCKIAIERLSAVP